MSCTLKTYLPIDTVIAIIFCARYVISLFYSKHFHLRLLTDILETFARDVALATIKTGYTDFGETPRKQKLHATTTFQLVSVFRRFLSDPNKFQLLFSRVVNLRVQLMISGPRWKFHVAL